MAKKKNVMREYILSKDTVGVKAVILTKNTYLDCDYLDYSIFNDFKKKGILRSFPKETYEGYRQTYEFEEDKSMTAILMYKIL